MKKPTVQFRQKKPTTGKPWLAAWWEWRDEDFTFTQDKKDRFLELIPDPELHSTAGKAIEDLVRRTLAHIEHMKVKPPNKAVRQQLTLLENQTKKLLHTLHNLHSTTGQILDRFSVISIQEFEKHSSGFLSDIRRAKYQRLLSKEAKGGRPRNVAMRRLVWELVFWWHAHIGMPDCYRDDIRKEGYEGDFYDFAVAVITPVLGNLGLDALIERVVAEYRKMMEKAEKGDFDTKN